MANSFKQIAFDLDTKSLKIYYLKNNWRKAYEDIKGFMYKNSFAWIQGSVYTSKRNMSNSNIRNIIRGLQIKFPYLNKCVRDIVVTNIGKTYKLNNLFDKDMDIPTKKEYQEQIQIKNT
ncbi:hypothetical protein HMPREF9628_01719 [Peptoanaerobacter stomatis]|uniref:Uncharacterized protein n=1 Tax=Peptoanaerobacter stomatis TaxID=796937 RepID=G9XCZ2_9FIRM|nr:hypothetical protein [Peptoanaerobacter stomatis]EHL19162.1 hypothetical protein HMPREF9628_01719 [Peptoanaerobacter stomatis]